MAIEKQHVLTKKERAVMRVIYQESDKKEGMCLLTPIDILSGISYDLDITPDDMDSALRNLEIDDYFDLTRSDKKGELVYCINMHQKGLSFARVEKALRKNIRFKLLLTLACGVLSGITALVIRSIFKSILGM